MSSTSTNPFQQVTIRGQQFWTKTRMSLRGVAYPVYQAIGAGNQDGPKDMSCLAGVETWYVTAKAALEGLRERQAEAALREATKASANVVAKAQRLGQSNRVVVLSGYHALVIGDSATYDVTKFGQKWSCNCKWGRTCARRGPCSHVVAVQAATPETQAPVARLAAIINDGMSKRQADAQANLAADEAMFERLFQTA